MEIGLGLFDQLDGATQASLCLRVVVAALCGCMIGYERSRRFKGAGVRTHVVIALSAALMTIVSKYGFFDVLELGMGTDASRVAAQIVTGIPFLGAGVILVKQHNTSVQGITTAAGMWGTCGIGMALGAGLYLIGLFATALLMATQFVFHRVLIGYDSSFSGEIVVVAERGFDVDECIYQRFRKYTVTLQKSQVKRMDDGRFQYRVSIKTMKEVPANDLAEILVKTPEFQSVEL